MNRKVKRILSVILAVALSVSLFAVAAFAETRNYLDADEAAVAIRQMIKERKTEISIDYLTNYNGELSEIPSILANPVELAKVTAQLITQVTAEFVDIFAEAFEHTGVPTEGDYMFYQYLGFVPHFDGFDYLQLVNGKIGMKANFTLSYRTDAEQEKAVDGAVAEVLAALQLEGKSTYDKVKAVYDWMSSNISYDFNGLANYATKPLASTAYAALFDKTAVCQGYSVLFYRLCLEAGIDARVVQNVTGLGAPHVWNVVKMDDGMYYYIDTTLGAGFEQEFSLSSDGFFLKGSDYWSKLPLYTLGDQYTNATLYPGFAESFPVSVSDYTTASVCGCAQHCDRFEAVAAGCYKDGNIEYWQCSECLNCYKDAACTIAVAPEDTVIKAHHTAVVTDAAKNASCTESGLTEGSHCTDCGDTIVAQQVIPAKGHDLKHNAAKSASILSKGHIEYWQCNSCGKCFTDAGAVNVIAQADTVTDSVIGSVISSITNFFKSLFKF